MFVFVMAAFSAKAQSSPAAQPQAATAGIPGCPAALPPSPGDEAMLHGQYAHAADLYATGSKTPGPAAEKAHDGLIRALLANDKVSSADADAKSWNAAEPSEPWAKLANAEVLWREGKVIEAQAAFQDLSKTAGCNAQLHADFARLLDAIGQSGTAVKQLALAHRLDSEDPTIHSRWLRTQPRSVRLQAVTDTLEHDKSLSDDERKSLQARKDALSSTAPATSCHLVNAITSVTIPYLRMRDGPNYPMVYGLPVAINGKQRRLELDTGASGLTIYRSAAAALHLPEEVQFKTGGIGDQIEVQSYAAKVDSIKIGGLEFANCYVEVIDDRNQKDSSGQKVDSPADGLIGGDVFSDFLITFDFPGQVFKLDPLPTPPGAVAKSQVSLDTDDDQDTPPRDRYIDPSMASWTRFYRSGHDIILPVILNNGPYRLFIVDTGAGLNLISPEAASEVGKVTAGSDVEVMGIAGSVKKVFTTAPIDLSFASLRQHTAGLTATDTSRWGHYDGLEISGFLGVPTLHQLTMQIDYRDNLIHFSFDPKRLRRCVPGVVIDDCY